MIRIYKGNDVKVVTQGVYKSLYAPLGYKQIIEEKKPKVVNQPKNKVKEEPVKKEELVKEEEPKEIIKESSNTKRKRGE